MTNIINAKRINQITTFLKSLNIKSKRFSEIIRTQNISIIQDFNQAFIHSSEDKIINYEKLEFFGDAVLRLAASNFIEKKYPQMSVGERSELRAQIVSDEWLTKLGKKIDIEKEESSIAFLIEEALEEKADFAKSGQISLQIEPTIKNSYGRITKENEITRYSVTLDVDYRLYNKRNKKIILSNKVSATSDYSAAVTFTGFATEIARKNTYERLADTVAEKMITEILISNLSEYAP